MAKAAESPSSGSGGTNAGHDLSYGEGLAANHAAAYRLTGQLLVQFRRLLDRAMRKHSGDDWFKSGCPTAVFQRLVARKETELEVDRGTEAYQELITYTDFADMAEIISGCEGVARLFKHLASSPQTLVRVLSGLERVRSRLAIAHDIADYELEDLERAHAAFLTFVRQAGKKGKTKPGDGNAPWDLLPSLPPLQQTPVEPPPADEAVGSAPTPEIAPPEVSHDPAEAKAIQLEVPPASPDPEPEPEPEASPEPEPEAPPEPDKPEVIETFGVEDALAAGDDGRVLLALRREVTALAEGIYGEPDNRRPAVWEMVTRRGWYDAREKSLGLAPIADFYAMADRYMELYGSNPAPEELETFLFENNFAKLLLTLREIFLAAGDG